MNSKYAKFIQRVGISNTTKKSCNPTCSALQQVFRQGTFIARIVAFDPSEKAHEEVEKC